MKAMCGIRGGSRCWGVFFKDFTLNSLVDRPLYIYIYYYFHSKILNYLHPVAIISFGHNL